MNDEELEKKMKSVGKKAFVHNYDLFEDFQRGRISRSDAIEKLVTAKVSNDAGANIRLGNAKLIFEHGRQFDALDLVLSSNRIDTQTRDLARQLKTSK